MLQAVISEENVVEMVNIHTSSKRNSEHIEDRKTHAWLIFNHKHHYINSGDQEEQEDCCRTYMIRTKDISSKKIKSFEKKI
jgi:hypothetical protein